MKHFDREKFLNEHIPHRMLAIEWYSRLLSSPSLMGQGRKMEVLLDGKMFLKGSHYALTNPAIEIGIVFVRVMLEFAGLRVNRKTQKIEVRPTDPEGSDVQIEDFSSPTGSLRAVTLSEMFDCSPAGQQVTHDAVVSAVNHAHKAVAHLTIGPRQDDGTVDELVLAGDVVINVLHRHLYDALKRPRPVLPITFTKS